MWVVITQAGLSTSFIPSSLVSLEEFRQMIHSDKDHVYKELAVIFDSIFNDEKMLRDTITHLKMEWNNVTDQITVKQSQIDELIAECDELNHILICMTTDEDTAHHIVSCMEENHLKQYQTAEEIFEHLKSIYEDANKLQNVKSDYHKLIMCNENNYHEFVTKFLHLADEVKIVKENYKTDFNDKLFFDLQRMMTVSDSQTSHSTSATKFSIIKKALSAHSDIQCYYCKEKDHIVRNCPVKQKSQQVITELTENDTSEPSADLRKEEIKLDKKIRQEHQTQLCRLKETSSVMTSKTRQGLTWEETASQMMDMNFIETASFHSYMKNKNLTVFITSLYEIDKQLEKK
ncbi:hypothetical protein PAAG_11912 [Paracoccidioides lutzii Pb01]|uniref:CCHC-type domain-containing protein n=1 Tax=Paracoccidioides lutzii (strain ATCC MYA-826 / Pb01) TaxID=502779 RepID=A0A0A2V5B0_PARBA|nr:hypothetical protein PAAG_11912 [Paracoccidioides lutzii Pb01]KGQ01335.1 hypothetical protein PAAG_11912 [Paracoccidioides lutzii Pb01]